MVLYFSASNKSPIDLLQRTTVSLAVIVFELTDTLTYAVPVMLSVLVAKTVADALEPKGIYDLVIESVVHEHILSLGLTYMIAQNGATPIPGREAELYLGSRPNQRSGKS